MQGLLKTVSLLLSPGSGLWEEAREGAVDGKKRDQRDILKSHINKTSQIIPLYLHKL